MSVNLTNRDPDLHLRDARHAHRLFNESNHAFSPKTKFLYHIQFEYYASTGDAPNSTQKSKEIAVLAKSVDLPQYRATVETVQQYNRKKNIQTRIDYDDIRMAFYDDNTGYTRAMLQEYYLYYFRDGSKNDGRGNPQQFDPRDKFNSSVYKYGMDNEKFDPFFKWIKIFQLSRQEWFSYTLINPLITTWGHDSLDYADGSGIMENTINVIYEGVLYNNGFISPNADPAGFTAPETRYDTVPSPLTANADYSTSPQPTVINPTNNNLNYNSSPTYVSNKSEPRGLIQQLINQQRNGVGGIPGIDIPRTNTQEPNR